MGLSVNGQNGANTGISCTTVYMINVKKLSFCLLLILNAHIASHTICDRYLGLCCQSLQAYVGSVVSVQQCRTYCSY